MAFLKFVDVTVWDDPRKTYKWVIFSEQSGDMLGEIRFHAPWRKYVWSMRQGVIFDIGCTQEIVKFLEDHGKDRR